MQIELIYDNNLFKELEIGTAAKRRISKRAIIQKKHFKPIQSILQLLIIKYSFNVSKNKIKRTPFTLDKNNQARSKSYLFD